VDRAEIRRERLRCEHAPVAAEVVRLRIGFQQSLRKRRRLGEKGPVPPLEHEARVRAAPRLAGGNDVEDGQALDAIGVVEREPVGAVGPAIVTRHGEVLESELTHHRHVVAGDRALRVRLVIGCGLGLRALAVAT
jgi:hypothetical protein